MRLSLADAAIVFQWSYEDEAFVGHVSRNKRFGGGDWQAIAHGSTLIEALGAMRAALELEAEEAGAVDLTHEPLSDD